MFRNFICIVKEGNKGNLCWSITEKPQPSNLTINYRKKILTGRTSISLINLVDTDSRASCGHSINQLIAVQLTIAGNFLALILNVDPTGEKQRIIFNSRRTLSIKNFQQFSLVS